MPIYAYRCASCGHAKDVLQKISDPPLTQCPACGAQTFSKQVTAAGFQLKGTGWYATDFKGGAKKPASSGDGKGTTASTEAKPSESGKGESTTGGSGSSDASAPAKSGDSSSGSVAAPKAAAAGDARA